jgi:hypothetical protein
MLTNNQFITTLEKLSTLSLTDVAFRVIQVTYLNTPLSSVSYIKALAPNVVNRIPAATISERAEVATFVNSV